jgi:hypothetical protein
VQRHTASSWRERYKKNRVEFDERIENLSGRLASTASQHVVYHRDRRLGAARRRWKDYLAASDDIVSAVGSEELIPEQADWQLGSNSGDFDNHTSMLDDPSLFTMDQEP